MNGSPESSRKRSSSSSQASQRQTRPRQDEEADETADSPAYNWWQEWTRDEVKTFVYCYTKELQAVKDANPGLDREAVSVLQNQELKRLVKHDMVNHYKKLKEHKQQKQKQKKELKSSQPTATQVTTSQQATTSRQATSRQETTSQHLVTNGKTEPKALTGPVENRVDRISYNDYKTDNSGSLNSSITLTDEQQAILDRIKDGQSLMFTGRAGTGKSLLIEEIAKWCRRNGVNCSVTATTGLAAMNIKGETIHRWSGLGFMKSSVSHCLAKLNKEDGKKVGNKGGKFNWCNTDLLIIDEASQLSASAFDKMDAIARHIRAERSEFEQGGSWARNYSPKGLHEDPRERNALKGRDLKDVPFGGMQVVCVGDFFQIPPIPDDNPPKNIEEGAKSWGKKQNAFVKGEKKQPKEPDFLFKSKAFQELYEHNKFCLTVAQRQEDGSDFSNMLESLRRFRGEKETAGALQSYFAQFVGTHDEDKEAVNLCGTNDEVSRINVENLKRLDGPEVCFIAFDYRNADYLDSEINNDLKKNVRAEAVIRLKPGAQIMFLKNNRELGLVNGHLGRVAFLLTEKLHREFKDDYRVLHPLYQYFRGTGVRMESLNKECPKDIEAVTGTHFTRPWSYYQQALMAIDSCYRTKAQAQLESYNTGNSRTNTIPADYNLNTSLEVIIKVGANQGTQSNEFHLVDCREFEKLDYTKPIVPEDLGAERTYPTIYRRTQLPLALSWALTVHKSQGQTLRRTMVNMRRLDGGQAYVALSRVRSPEDLRLVAFELPVKLTPLSVHEFDKTMKSVLE